MTPTFVNPSQELDYRRFSNDAFLEEFFEEREILKRARPEIPLTTNFMGFSSPSTTLPGRRSSTWYRPTITLTRRPEWPMLSGHPLRPGPLRKQERAWMVMEQTSLRVNWRQHNSAKVPGQMRALSYQAVARGAAEFSFSSGGHHNREPRSSIRPCSRTRGGFPGVGGGGRAGRRAGPVGLICGGLGGRPGPPGGPLLGQLVGRGGPAKPANDLKHDGPVGVDVPAPFPLRRQRRLLPARRAA